MDFIHKRLKYVREKLEYNSQNFSHILGLSESSYSKYESGKYKFNNIKLFIDLYEKYQISPAWMLTGKGNIQIDNVSKVSSEIASDIDLLQNMKLDIGKELKKIIINHILIQIYNDHALFSPGNRQEFFLASILKYLSSKQLKDSYNKGPNDKDPYDKDTLIKDINSYTIKKPFEFEFDRKNLLNSLDRLREEEFFYLITHVDIALEVNKKFIDPLTNFVEEKRKSLLKLAS